MGMKGTEAAKQAGAIVLADDNFASIAHAVEEGRTVYDNLRKTVTFLLPINGGESLSLLLAVLLGLALPITPVQVLWVNMVSSVALAMVLAFEPTLRAAPHKSAVAVATVVLFGTLSMFLYPVFYHAGWLNFDTQALGIYIGGTVHEVAQVVGAASNIDPATTEVATIVKMTRVALLVPVLLILGMYLRSAASHAGGGQGKGQKLPIPWFAVGFLALAIVNSLNIIPADIVAAIRRLDVFALTMAMTALGIETRFAQIRKAGPRVMALGFILYVWLLVGGYGIVKLAT